MSGAKHREGATASGSTVTLENCPTSDASPPPGPGAAVRRSTADLVGQRLLHFRVVARLGAGSMGVVYRAVDEKLRRQVALKVLSDRYPDDASRRRLLREARSAAAVGHANVATIHEVNDTGDVSFIAMEYVTGDTLRARLSQGPVSLDEALRYAREIAAGLASAHATGIVHRDLKPDNVMVRQDGHVKLLDFGLARPLSDDGADAPSLGDEGIEASAMSPELSRVREQIVGTPNYMPPEQARGEPADARSDVFSFGATLFELLTGKPPFARAARAPWDWKEQADWTPREPLSAAVPGLDPRLVAVVSRCLAYRPEDRYASGGELVAALAAIPSHESRAGPRRRRRWAAALVAAAALAGGGAWWLERPVSPAPRSVALLVPPDSASREYGWIAVAAERRVAAELLAAGRIRVVPADKAADHPASTEILGGAAPALLRFSRDVGVERTIVIRSEVPPGAHDRVTIAAALYDAGGARTDTLRESGSPSDALVLGARLAQELRGRLHVARPESLASASASLPGNSKAARRYAEGIALRKVFDFDGARRALEEARELDPEAPLVHDALAELWAYLGYEDRAAAESRRALELASMLRHEERLRVEARAAVATHQWDRAIEAYRALALLIPDEWDDALAAVDTMRRAGRLSDAMAAVEQLAQRAGASTEPRLLLIRAQLQSLRYDWSAARETARAARALALAVGLSGIVTRADEVICAAAAQSGDPEEARAACQRAIAAYHAAGDVVGEAAPAAQFARNQIELGRLDDARAILDDIEPRIRRLGPSRGLVSVLKGRANLAQKASQNDQQLAASREALTIARALGSASILSGALSALASAEYSRARMASARALYEEATEVAKAAGLLPLAAHALQNLALVHQREGHDDLAKAAVDESLALYRQVHESFNIAWTLDTAGLIAIDMDQLDEAQAFIEEALAVRTANKLMGGQSRQNLADVLLAKGEIDRALTESARAVEEFHERHHGGEIFALEVYARALLAKGDARAALEACRRALAAEHPSALHDTRLLFAPTIAKAKYALGDRGAIAELEALVRDLPDQQARNAYSARLRLGELYMQAGEVRRGRALVAHVLADARAGGDKGIANEASRVLASRVSAAPR